MRFPLLLTLYVYPAFIRVASEAPPYTIPHIQNITIILIFRNAIYKIPLPLVRLDYQPGKALLMPGYWYCER